MKNIIFFLGFICLTIVQSSAQSLAAEVQSEYSDINSTSRVERNSDGVLVAIEEGTNQIEYYTTQISLASNQTELLDLIRQMGADPKCSKFPGCTQILLKEADKNAFKVVLRKFYKVLAERGSTLIYSGFGDIIRSSEPQIYNAIDSASSVADMFEALSASAK